MLPAEISFLSPISLNIMHNVTPLIYTLEIERANRRLDPFISYFYGSITVKLTGLCGAKRNTIPSKAIC